MLWIIIGLCVLLMGMNSVVGLGAFITFLIYVYINQRNEKMEVIKMLCDRRNMKSGFEVHDFRTTVQWDLTVYYDIKIDYHVNRLEFGGNYLSVLQNIISLDQKKSNREN